jgi:FkbM family methyltransferase
MMRIAFTPHARRVSLGTTIERLRLRALPKVTGNYLWVSVDGLRVYGTREHHVMLYWLVRGKYERHTRALFEQAIRPGMHVLDLGAHIGYFTLLAARAVGSTGKVYSFEPDPANYKFLCHNIALNGMEGVVVPVPKAVTDSSGARPFFAHTKNSAASTFWGEGQPFDPLSIECTTIDDYIEEGEAIHVVKLDVEGAEVEALRGMRRTLTEARRTALFVECNPTALAAAGVSVRELLDELNALGFQVQLIDEKPRSLLPITSELLKPELADGRWYANLYCTRSAPGSA